MLSSEDQDIIKKNFNIYEHNWRYYEEFLGEALLLDDVVVYSDGRGIFFPAFSLSRPGYEFTYTEIADYIKRACDSFKNCRMEFVDLWGQFGTLPAKYAMPDGQIFSLLSQSDYHEDGFESVFDLHDFDKNPPKSAVKRIKALAHKPLSITVEPAVFLSAEHLALMEQWISSHEVSDSHKEYMFALKPYIRRPDVYLCDVRSHGVLIGFSVFGVVSATTMVVVSSFLTRGEGMRVGDALFHSAIQFARAHGLHRIHRGYSATETLLKIKESWGCTIRSALYREALYTGSEAIREQCTKGSILWRARITDFKWRPEKSET